MSRPDELHEWISFEDPDEYRTWMIDASFLRSDYKCIYGEGCKGVLDDDATHLSQGCCSFGAHFMDDADVKTVKISSKRLTAEVWQNKSKADTRGWSAKNKDGTVKTRVVNGACIFHNEPDFPGGGGCALHIAAMQAGERPMDWKPDVCWQVPLRVEEVREDEGHVISIVREWKRRDWGPGGEDFHWWCTDAPDAFVGKNPAYKYFKDELTEMVGKKIYKLIAEQLDQPAGVPLPHPAVRNRRNR